MNQNNWKEEKKWSDRFLPEIKSHLGMTLIGEPPIEEDQERNTDLIVLKMEPVRIGCRVRRNEYYEKYRNEFTIRSKLASGEKTELHKIIEGWGDYFFYGICDKEEFSLICWFIGDLKVFRLWFAKYLKNKKGVTPGEEHKNWDGLTWLRAFKINDLPSGFIINQVV